MKTSALKRHKPMNRGTSQLKRSPMKKSRPKSTPIRKSAKGEECTIRLAGVCKPEPGNVVWAHSNDAKHGKGAGLKAEDQYGCYACYWCHLIYDGQAPRPVWLSEEEVDFAFELAMQESRGILKRKGLLHAS